MKVFLVRTMISLVLIALSVSWGAMILMAADAARPFLDEGSVGEMASTIFFVGVLALFGIVSKVTRGLHI